MTPPFMNFSGALYIGNSCNQLSFGVTVSLPGGDDEETTLPLADPVLPARAEAARQMDESFALRSPSPVPRRVLAAYGGGGRDRCPLPPPLRLVPSPETPTD